MATLVYINQPMTQVHIDDEKHIFCAHGQQFDVFFYDEGNGWSHILATQPASSDGQPTPEINDLICGLADLLDVYSEADEE
jgi:hypothetical protein